MNIKARTGRPPKQPTGPTATLTLRITAQTKTLLIEQADAYDLTITEYLTALIHRDAQNTKTHNQP